MRNKKFDFFFQKKFEIEFDLYFDLCWRAEINIQVGLNMHLYVDIGDASSSLWGSTSSYASPTSGEAYRDRQLTTNFEFWVEIFCVPSCFHVRIPKPCLSVSLSVCLSICPNPEKRNHHSFVNISPTLVIDTSMERSSRVLHHGNQKIWIFSKKFEIRILTKSWNHLSFVNISPTLVIDTSMERSSRVLQHGNPKLIFFFSKKFEIRILMKSWNLLSFVNISPTLVFDTSMERSSRVLEHGNNNLI